MFTIGYQGRPWPEFLGLLTEAKVRHVVDVRTYPTSKPWPCYSQRPLRNKLEAEGMGYHAWGRLMGSAHWEGLSVANRQATVTLLLQSPQLKPMPHTCLLCMEADPRRCHRSDIAWFIEKAGEPVTHLGTRTAHPVDPPSLFGDPT